MIKSIRIHHTSDGGSLEIGASDKSVIEVNGQKFALSMLATLADPKNAGATFAITTVGGVVGIESHACPLPAPVEADTEAQPTRRARRTKDFAES